MKLRNLLLAVAFTAIGSTSFAFHVSDVDIAFTRDKLERNFSTEIDTKKKEAIMKDLNYMLSVYKSYDIEFEFRQDVMVIKCPYDGGISSYWVRGREPLLIKSTDKCEHKIIAEINNEPFMYLDYMPFTLARMYCSWRYGKSETFDETWKRYGKHPVKAVK